MVLHTARTAPVKTLESFDFSFQPSLDRGRVMTLAELVEALLKVEREGRSSLRMSAQGATKGRC